MLHAVHVGTCKEMWIMNVLDACTKQMEMSESARLEVFHKDLKANTKLKIKALFKLKLL